jgi:hypothetical protein
MKSRQVSAKRPISSPQACDLIAPAPPSADSDERKVTLPLLQNVLNAYEGRGAAGDVLEVIDAFQSPLILYDPIRKLFHQVTAPRKIFADASVRTSYG